MTNAKNILEIKDLSRTYTLKRRWGQSKKFYAVQDLHLSLEKGKCLGLVGESGCGKSTLARMMLGLLTPSKGTVRIDGEILFSAESASKKQKYYPDKIQMVFQDPFSSLNPRLSIGRSIAEPLHLSDKSLDAKTLKERVYEALLEVGLEKEHYERFPHEFSGGQRQRIALARALITRPSIVICDEPVSALDTSIQASVLNLMQDIQKRLEISYVFISHDLHVVAYMSDEIAIMYAGKIVEKASKDTIFEKALHPYTRALLSAAPSLTNHHKIFSEDFIKLNGEPPNPLNPPTGCSFHPRCAYAKEICTQKIPLLRNLGDTHHIACHFTE